MEIFLKPEAWGALATLIFLEIILGIDNVIFISIVSNRLPRETRAKARRFGLALALVIRVIMLFTITWIMEFKNPLFVLFDTAFSMRDIILAGGGMFLIYKSTTEISKEVDKEGEDDEVFKKKNKYSVASVILQIVLIDFIFSFDSILTAVGLSDMILIMVTAVLVSILIMMAFLDAIGEFIKRNPSMEVLALGFLILIGFILLLEAFHYEIPKGYIYFAIAFSFLIELINIRKRKYKREQKLALVNPAQSQLELTN
jgi:predicted tellurium resistance membrane protein TerC